MRPETNSPSRVAATKAQAPSQLDVLLAFACGLALFAAYQANGDFLPGDDATGNIVTAAHFLEGRGPTFTPANEPYMFFWDLLDSNGSRRVLVSDWQKTLIDGVPAQDMRAQGRLKLRGPDYYLVPSKGSNSASPTYVSIFGPGAAVSSLPVFLASRCIWGDKLLHDPKLLWYTGKTAASIFVAASGALVFLIARRFLSRGPAILIGLSYGLGTCVWSTSSQTLWQHGPNEFFLALGTYFLARLHQGITSRPLRMALAAGCGLSYACAGACRPTSFVVVICVAVYLLASQRHSLLAYLIGSLAPIVAIASYNDRFLGSPWAFGQISAASSIALEKTGASGVWQTPLWMGLAGHLVSPSRGLFIFSPILAFSLIGIYRIWRESRWSFLRPLTIAVGIVLVIESKHFDWWSGWAYGYRHVVDTCVLLAIFLIPAVRWFMPRKWLAVYFVLLAWSIAVQVIGAFAYDVVGWNFRWLGTRVLMPGRATSVIVTDPVELQHVLERGAGSLGQIQGDIDLPQYRYRLWAVRDNEIGYYLKHFWASREIKHALMREAKGGSRE
jgi:hypothetical protein